MPARRNLSNGPSGGSRLQPHHGWLPSDCARHFETRRRSTDAIGFVRSSGVWVLPVQMVPRAK